MCTRCGVRQAREDGYTCCSCAAEAEFVAGRVSHLPLRPCPVCRGRMLRSPTTDGLLVCREADCLAEFDMATSRLSYHGVEPARAAGKNANGANQIIRNDARKLHKERDGQIVESTSGGLIPAGTRPEVLVRLVLEGLDQDTRKKAFDKLIAAGADAKLQFIADSDSAYARSARAELDRRNRL